MKHWLTEHLVWKKLLLWRSLHCWQNLYTPSQPSKVTEEKHSQTLFRFQTNTMTEEKVFVEWHDDKDFFLHHLWGTCTCIAVFSVSLSALSFKVFSSASQRCLESLQRLCCCVWVIWGKAFYICNWLTSGITLLELLQSLIHRCCSWRGSYSCFLVGCLIFENYLEPSGKLLMPSIHSCRTWTLVCDTDFCSD